MKIVELRDCCLGAWKTTVKVERPIALNVPSEILYQGTFENLPTSIAEMEFKCFSANDAKRELGADDIVIYID